MRIRAAPPALRVAPWPALMIATAVLSGCGLTDPAPTLPEARAVMAGVSPPPGQRALRVRLGGGRHALAALLQEQRERRLWRTEGGLALATDGPRVVGTSGLPQVLMATRIDGPDPLTAPETLLAGPAAARRLVDLGTAARDPAEMRFGLEILCRLSAAPVPEEEAVLLVTEDCRGPRGVGAFTNRFWVRRADGAVLRSEQWVGPGLPSLVLEAAGS